MQYPGIATNETHRGPFVWHSEQMATWIALVRGINVGGANKVAMADLRALVTSLGHTNVSTYIQSGNVVLTSPRSDRAMLAAEIAEGIERVHSLVVSVVLRTPRELRAALAANPFTSEADGTKVTITFLSEAPSPGAVSRLEPQRFVPDRFELRSSEIYAHYPNGAGRSKLTLDYYEKKLAVRGTARNLKTVAKLIELTSD